MPYSKIHFIDTFDAFHRMAKGAVQARHGEVQVFAFSEVGQGATPETPLFKTTFYQVGLFSDVRFEVTYFDTLRLVDRKNAVVLFKPGQTCSFRRAAPDTKGYAIMFQEHFVDWRWNNTNTVRDFSILDPAFECVLFLEDDAFADLMEIAAKMHREYSDPINAHSLHILKLYCQILVEKLNRLSAGRRSSTQDVIPYKTTQDFKALVYQNIHKTKTVADYAGMLCVTEKTLINHIRRTTEWTPKEFINAVIVEESKAMLASRSTVEQVAAYFNFTDQAHFSNFFRKKTGLTPNDFKKK